MYLKPWFSWPMQFSTGTFTSSMVISATRLDR